MTAYFDEKDRLLDLLDVNDFEAFDAIIVKDMDLGVFFLNRHFCRDFGDGIHRKYIDSMNAILRGHFLTALHYNHKDAPDYEDMDAQRAGYRRGLQQLHTWWHNVATEYRVSDDPKFAIRSFLEDMKELRA